MSLLTQIFNPPESLSGDEDFLLNCDIIQIDTFVSNIQLMLLSLNLPSSNNGVSTTSESTTPVASIDPSCSVIHDPPELTNPRPSNWKKGNNKVQGRKQLLKLPSFLDPYEGHGIVLSILSDAKNEGFQNSMGYRK